MPDSSIAGVILAGGRSRRMGSVAKAHEMLGTGQESRHGCEFNMLFACPEGATPDALLRRGIYGEIAVPLMGGAWREASMVLLSLALSMTSEEVEDAKTGASILEVDVSKTTSLKRRTSLMGRVSSRAKTLILSQKAALRLIAPNRAGQVAAGSSTATPMHGSVAASSSTAANVHVELHSATHCEGTDSPDAHAMPTRTASEEAKL